MCQPERLESPHWVPYFEAALRLAVAGGETSSVECTQISPDNKEGCGEETWSWQRHFLSAEDLDFGASGGSREVFEAAEPYPVQLLKKKKTKPNNNNNKNPPKNVTANVKQLSR